MRSRPALPALLFGALTLLACARPVELESRSSASHRPLALVLAADARFDPTAVVVERFEPAAERDEWDVKATVVEQRPQPSGAGELLLVGAKLDRPIDVARNGSYDTSRFNQVHVSATFAGRGELLVAFFQGDEYLGRSLAQPLVKSEGLRTTVLTVPVEMESMTFDRLVVRIDGSKRAFGIASVELLQQSPAGLLPPPDAPGLIGLEGEWRRGVGLVPGAPLVTSFRASAGTRLAFSFAEAVETARAGRALALGVQLTAANRAAREERLPLEQVADGDPAQGNRWRSGRIDLSDFDGHEVTARFELHAPDERPAACALAEVALREDRPGPPSVLLITSDTHRGDHLGAAGHPALRTPAIDALAVRGIAFEQCFTSINYTNPSHVALMTGQHPRDTGIVVNGQRLNTNPRTLAEILQARGWVTWASVSTRHLLDDVSGLGQGFDRMSGPLDIERRAEDAVGDLLRWLPDRDGRPLFCWLHVFDAHWPYAPPDDFDRMYYDSTGEPEPWPMAIPQGREHALEIDDLRLPRAQYQAEITYLDGQLARVFAAEPFRDGLTVFTSDHGESLGQHGSYFSHTGLFPDQLHVPLVLAWPGAPAGARVAGHVSHLDIGSTVLELLQIDERSFGGESLLRHLERRPDEALYALHADEISASLTRDGYHFIQYFVDHESSSGLFRHHAGQIEMFDLDADPECLRDLAQDEPERARAMQSDLEGWLERRETLGWSEAIQLDSDVRAQLEELGYADPAESR